MDPDRLITLQRVSEEELIPLFNDAYIAVADALLDDSTDRWSVAAEQLCGLLTFVSESSDLWDGMHECVDGLREARGELAEIRERLDEFTHAERELLLRRGVHPGAAAKLATDVTNALMSLINPSHDAIDATRDAFVAMTDGICVGVDDWDMFSKSERHTKTITNTVAGVGGAGGIVLTVINAATTPVLWMTAGSIAGGIATTVGSLIGFRRR